MAPATMADPTKGKEACLGPPVRGLSMSVVDAAIEAVDAVTETRLLDGPIEVLCEFDAYSGIHARYVFELDWELNALGPTTRKK